MLSCWCTHSELGTHNYTRTDIRTRAQANTHSHTTTSTETTNTNRCISTTTNTRNHTCIRTRTNTATHNNKRKHMLAHYNINKLTHATTLQHKQNDRRILIRPEIDAHNQALQHIQTNRIFLKEKQWRPPSKTKKRGGSLSQGKTKARDSVSTALLQSVPK
jgi:hypothetical protein